MANKWRVTYKDCILGHYAAKTPEEAVAKAVDRCGIYHPEITDGNSSFTVVRAGNAANKVFEVIG